MAPHLPQSKSQILTTTYTFLSNLAPVIFLTSFPIISAFTHLSPATLISSLPVPWTYQAHFYLRVCTGPSLGLECSSPRYLHGSLSLLLQVFRQKFYSQWYPPWLSYFKVAHIPPPWVLPIPLSCFIFSIAFIFYLAL